MMSRCHLGEQKCQASGRHPGAGAWAPSWAMGNPLRAKVQAGLPAPTQTRQGCGTGHGRPGVREGAQLEARRCPPGGPAGRLPFEGRKLRGDTPSTPALGRCERDVSPCRRLRHHSNKCDGSDWSVAWHLHLHCLGLPGRALAFGGDRREARLPCLPLGPPAPCHCLSALGSLPPSLLRSRVGGGSPSEPWVRPRDRRAVPEGGSHSCSVDSPRVHRDVTCGDAGHGRTGRSDGPLPADREKEGPGRGGAGGPGGRGDGAHGTS